MCCGRYAYVREKTLIAYCPGWCKTHYGGTTKGANTKLGQSLYMMGYNFCTKCGLFIPKKHIHKGANCPCCGAKTRSKPYIQHGRFRKNIDRFGENTVCNYWLRRREEHRSD